MTERARTLRGKDRKGVAYRSAKTAAFGHASKVMASSGKDLFAFPRGVRGEVAKLAVKGVLARAARVDVNAATRMLADLKELSAPEAEAIELLSKAERAPVTSTRPWRQRFGAGTSDAPQFCAMRRC